VRLEFFLPPSTEYSRTSHSYRSMRIAIPLQLVLLLVPAVINAQQAPYDNPPEAEPPYYQVRYEASTEPDELIFPVAYTVWIPPECSRLRGVIVHQHGCGEGSCKSGQTGAFDLHWQALARKHDCALLSPSYEQPEGADCQKWCDPRHGSAAAYHRALAELGELSGHPELATVPWALWGHSGGGHWAGGMVLLYPERVIAAWLRSGVPLLEAVEGRSIRPHDLPEAALRVPIMCNVGTQEGVTVKDGRFSSVWPSNEIFFRAMRSRHALIGVSVDPLSSHECGNQRYLAIPWFDACLSARLPANPEEPLRPLAAEDGWVAPLWAGESEVIAAVPAPEFTGELAGSVWLPNQAVAEAWRQYTIDTEVVDTTPPPAPSRVRLNGDELTWGAEADLESGIAYFMIEHHGRQVATVPETPRHSFGRPLFQGLQYSDTPGVPLAQMRYRIQEVPVGDAAQFRVITVNTVGLKSKPATAE
jgi:pimeloyl-ACP methyl ester carboxylesterase